MRLSCYWSWISSSHCQSSLQIHSAIASWIHSYFDNVMTKFMINNRTDAWKTDVNLLRTICSPQLIKLSIRSRASAEQGASKTKRSVSNQRLVAISCTYIVIESSLNSRLLSWKSIKFSREPTGVSRLTLTTFCCARVATIAHVLRTCVWRIVFVPRVMKHAGCLRFSILHVVALEELWTFVLGTKQSVRITYVQFHSFGSRIYLVHFNVCRKPGLAEPETLKLGCSKWTKLVAVSLYVSLWMFGFTTGCIKVKVLSFRRLFTCMIMRSTWAS